MDHVRTIVPHTYFSLTYPHGALCDLPCTVLVQRNNLSPPSLCIPHNFIAVNFCLGSLRFFHLVRGVARLCSCVSVGRFMGTLVGYVILFYCGALPLRTDYLVMYGYLS